MVETKGFKNVMENCRENARVLREGIERMGRFEVVSKDVGVPLVAFTLKDSSKHTVFEIAENLRRFGWIVPAYTMPPDAQHIAVLRVVIREDFSRSLAERLISDIDKVLKEVDALPIRVAVKAGIEDGGRISKHEKKSDREIEEITSYWGRLVDGKRTGAC